ncbi:MAG TPA: TolC family protein [Thermoanaerobaculia bacterium]|nr:TolC family protein [Thermoanaerobaculia bacterium]
MKRAALLVAALLAAAAARGETLTLTLSDAIDRALAESTASKIASLGIDEARAAAARAKTALNPRVDAVVSDVNQSLNLQTFGLTFPGVPPIVPPFNVFDAHIAASMNVIDVAARRRVAAARQQIRVSESEREQSDADVASAVASLYLTIRRTESLVDETRANVDLFEKLRGQAAHAQEVGTGTRLDTTRADVQLSRQRQALLVAETQRDVARLALLRAVGADLADTLVLAGRFEPPAGELPTPEAAIAAARKQRPDLRALDENLVAARLSLAAARGERWPRLAAQFQGGYNGNYLGDLSWTRIVGGSLAFPVYSGGEIAARIEEARLQERSLEIRRDDLDRRIQEEVRRALLAYRSAVSRSALAGENARLAADELRFATDRFVNGVASGIEVDNAQTSVTAARDAREAALADQEQAWIELKHATGEIRDVAGKENP